MIAFVMARLRRVSPFVWLAVFAALAAPLYLRYFAWAMGACGVVTFTPIR